MTVLLDTHALLWFHAGDRRLSRAARRAIEAEETDLVISTATAWEMAIKVSTGRLRLPAAIEDFISDKIGQGYTIWPITWEHAARVSSLPWHHRDPFDRLLVAQALVERCSIVSVDRVLKKYGVEVIW